MNGILGQMTERLLALVVALAVVSAPAALEVCQVTCESTATLPSAPQAESHAVHHHMPAHRASCHEHAAAAQQVSRGSIPCDHGTRATPGLVAAKNSDTAVALPAVVPARHSIATGETRHTVAARESALSDRLAVPLAIPLRV